MRESYQFYRQTTLDDLDVGVVGNDFTAVLATLLQVPIQDIPAFDGADWIKDVNAWLLPRNYAFICVDNLPDALREYGISGLKHAVLGTHQKTGWRHTCLGKDGQLTFDPHPDNEGLRVIDTYGVLVCLAPHNFQLKN